MRLLLDEHLSKDLASALRDRGHDVVAVTERDDLIQKRDDELLAVGQVEGRAIVTSNVRDFRPLGAQAVLSGAGHAGLVLIPPGYRRTCADIGRLVTALDRLLDEHPEASGLESQETWIDTPD